MEMHYGIIKRYEGKRVISGLYMETITMNKGNTFPERAIFIVKMEFCIETGSFYDHPYMLDIKKLV